MVGAGAMELPVIWTNILGPTEASQNYENGLIIEKKDIKGLKNAIISLYSDSELAKELGQRGYENVKENYEQTSLFKYILQDREKLLKK